MLNNFSIRIITNDIDEPLYTIDLIKTPININSSLGTITYKGIIEFANRVYAIVQAIINENNKNVNKVETEQKSYNGLEQLEKLAELKEKGIITEQEFEDSKKKILSKL